jgi:unsaturated rhamnogalacturonyl hydrolase
VIERVAAATMALAFKRWGFGESIAMQALLAAGGPARAYAAGLLDRWAAAAPPLADDPLAHVAPGVPLLEVYRQTGAPHLLSRARELAASLARTGVGRHGARIHRPDLVGWEHEVWVDCMHLDGPFLAALARVETDERWADIGADMLLSHARVLQDERTGLFSHGFDDASGRANAVYWGRGQGWALLGLVETLHALPAGHAAVDEIAQRVLRLIHGLAGCEVLPGAWHTVVDAPDTYLEPSIGAFVAFGVGRALDGGLAPSSLAALAERALTATRLAIDPRGRLAGVSDATPVGADTQHYAGRPRGVFAWGQGPALLALLHDAQPEST